MQDNMEQAWAWHVVRSHCKQLTLHTVRNCGSKTTVSSKCTHTHMPNTGTESTGWSRYTHGVMYTVHQSSTPCDHKVRWLWTAESSNNCRLMSWRIQVATIIQVPVLLWASCHRCFCAAYAAPITGHWWAWIAGLTIFGRLCYHEIVLITVAIEEYVHERSLSVL